MRYDYIDPFINATMRILGAVIPGAIRQGEVGMLRSEEIRGEVNVMIGVSGDAEGDVVISMDTETALNVCSTLLGSHPAALDATVLDALGELGNMIAGNAVSALNDLGFDFRMHPPWTRAGHGIRQQPGREALQIPLASSCGTMTMNVILGAE